MEGCSIPESKNMIELVKVKDREDGNKKAHEILKDIVDGQTLLALSGGTSVDYGVMLVQADDVVPGAICVVDERYGEPFHADSNELLLKNAGVWDWADKRNIKAHKILLGKGFETTAEDYNQLMSELLVKYDKKIGVMGVGANLHTGGIFPNGTAAHSASFVVGETVEDKFSKRITLTLKALGEFTNFVILMFGEAKREAVKLMLNEEVNDMQKYPAIFYRKVPIKSYLITDQEVE